MVIIAWNPSGSLAAFFYEDVFKRVTSIFVTSAFLNLLQGTGDTRIFKFFLPQYHLIWGQQLSEAVIV